MSRLQVPAPLVLFAWFTLSWLLSPLRKFPGPFLAGYTNLWRIAQVRTGRYHLNIKKLHEKYGPIVRIGPNLLDLDYPEMNRVIYSTDGKWTKTEFYKNNSAMVNGVQTFTIFSELDQGQHARMKRPLAKFISLGHVLALEPHMDSVVNELIGYIDTRFVKPKKTCNLGEWIAFYAWDLIGSVTFSKQMGYMEAEKDFDHTLAIADKALDYFAVVGQMPWLDYWLDKNPVVRVGPPNLTNVMRIALESLIARLQGKDANYGPKAPDYLQHYIGTKETHPDLVDDGMIIGFLLVNLLAGVDTTAITIRALFDFVLRRPDVYRKLVKEIRGARFDVDKSAPYSAAPTRGTFAATPDDPIKLYEYPTEVGDMLPAGASFRPPPRSVSITVAYLQC
ncbi:cytochrome P450 [Parachaetomium inaequale]|uniref:Cytochrome P450 n=1 Tax=Parachaetomium inaequale TaxID=2588326 RepID=A0AAN6P4T2_9PEZI|nr:cytochrome P450 [Parachaetomium inaequale]